MGDGTLADIIQRRQEAVSRNIARSNVLLAAQAGSNAYALMLLERSTHERLLDPCGD